MDRDELKRQVETLRYHKSIERIPVSEAIKRLIEFIDEKMPEDGLVVTPDKKKNPWAESRKCAIL